MWWALCLVVTVHAAAPEYWYDDSDHFKDNYDFYDEEEVSSSTIKNVFTIYPHASARRLEGTKTVHHAFDVEGIKGVLKQLFSGRRLDNSFPFPGLTTQYHYDTGISKSPTRTKQYYVDSFKSLDSHLASISGKRTQRPKRHEEFWFPEQYADLRQGSDIPPGSKEPTPAPSSAPTTLSATSKSTPTTTKSSSSSHTTTQSSSSDTTSSSSSSGSTSSSSSNKTTSSSSSNKTTSSSSSNKTTSSSGSSSLTTVTGNITLENTTTTMQTTKTRRTKSPRFDIEALLDIVANLTYDYDTNLTQVLNETLQKYSIPTCKTPTTTVTTTTVTTTEVFYSTSIISKCFVCGLDIPGIPRNTFCADAFATDFLPLVPIDGTAKGHLSEFRKHCRYFDVNNYQSNKSDPRAMLGRWTGGCSVRWIDLSGVYTQRSCRNRMHPTMGLHYASKRMAKLELALSNVDDGCIISPMATLVPFSRGISLYARFHACVCSGNWCNRSTPAHKTSWNTYYLFLLLMEISEVIFFCNES